MKKNLSKCASLNAIAAAYMQVIKEQVEDTQPPVDDTTTAPATTPAENEENLTTITFKTADPTIIDVFNSGFASATFNVLVKSEGSEDGEGGEDETKPVDVDGSLISGIEVIPPENEGGETCPECGNNPCTCDTTVTECGENGCESEVTEEDEE